MLGDPPPQRDEEPEWESEMHNGSWTKNTKSTVEEQIRWDQNQDRIMESQIQTEIKDQEERQQHT
jgi:hypothetical protein